MNFLLELLFLSYREDYVMYLKHLSLTLLQLDISYFSVLSMVNLWFLSLQVNKPFAA